MPSHGFLLLIHRDHVVAVVQQDQPFFLRGNLVVDKPGRYVLLTDDTLIPRFQGAAVRDGEPVGRRLSTVGYDFPTDPTNNFLNLAGFFTFGQKLSGTLMLPFDHPTNPYRHKFHPDHDNLNARFDGRGYRRLPARS